MPHPSCLMPQASCLTLINSIGKLYKAGSKVTTTKLWDLDMCIGENLGNILEHLSGSCLEESALPQASSSSQQQPPVLTTPLHWEVEEWHESNPRLSYKHMESACMFWSKDKVRLLEHTEPKGPCKLRKVTNEDSHDTSVSLLLTLGYIRGQPIKEQAARLVQMSCAGLPPVSESGEPIKWQVNHRCSHRGCISPLHLYYGTQKDNRGDTSQRVGHRKRQR